MNNTYHNNESGGELFDTNQPAPSDGLDLLTDPIEMAGDPVALSREEPNGRLVETDPPETEFGVDRNQSGSFVSRDREATTLVRHDDGEFGSDPFAVGNFGAFDEDGRYSTEGQG